MDFLSRDTLILALGVALVAFALLSWVLMYHWKNYAFNFEKVRWMTRLYFGVAIFFLLVMLAAIFYARS